MSSHPGPRGILGSVTRLHLWLHVVLMITVATCAIRYLTRHELNATALVILLGALGLAVWYALRSVLIRRGWLWVSVLVALWAVLTWLAPSFAWTAVPIAFAVLQVVIFEVAALTVLAMTGLASAASLRIGKGFDPTLIAGPLGIALVTLVAYRYLEQEAVARQNLVDQLRAAQVDLAQAQRRSGALTERNRISRELHDSIGQGLSSITLLLAAAVEQWHTPSAREYVSTATTAARDALVQVRAVVRDLASSDNWAGDESVAQALQRVLDQAAPSVETRMRVHGCPNTLPRPVCAALVRTVQGALANIQEHARASTVTVTVTVESAEVHLDIHDDGIGFDPTRLARTRGRGLGLPGIAQRAAELGGSSAVESSPGEGTTVSVRLPVTGGAP